MFRKIHLQFTLLCAGITVLVTVLMSAGYLFISEKNLRENHFNSFQSDMNTLLSNLESQTVITHEWLSKIEGNGKYIINIRDNGVDFLWGNRDENAPRRQAIDAGWAYYEDHFEVESTLSPFDTHHTEYAFSSSGRGAADYYGCAAFSIRETGTLSVLILEPILTLEEQILRQRLTFAALVLAACLVLSLFSWYFTGRLLIPIEKSRNSQIQFVAAASHELRTPLTVILSAASACKKARPDEQDRFFDIIQEEGNGMSRLISDLLTLAGADSQSFTIQKQPCEADTLLLTVFEAFEPLAREKGYRLSISLPDKKIAPADCDSDRIRQVLSILIHNAFCYTPPGSSILLSVKDSAEGILLSVSDNGPGISSEDREHIFERFYRADSSRSAGHFGLGLSIAAEILHAHHGRLTVCDTPGGGSTFTLLLPQAKS